MPVKSKTGFTLLEVMLALVILAIAIIGTSMFFYANRRNLHQARIQRQATWSAVEGMETWKGKPYHLLIDGVYEDSVEFKDISAGRTTTIETVTENGVTYKMITVEVIWNHGDVSLATYLVN